MDSIISTFHIDWKIIIAQAINFVVVFVVLYLFALKPLNKLMKERAEKIQKGISDAKTNASMLQKTEKEYEEAMMKARLEANAIFQNAKKEAEKKKAEMMEDAKKEVSTMVASGKKSLEAEKTKMVEDAKKEIISIAMAATEKLVASKKDLNNL